MGRKPRPAGPFHVVTTRRQGAQRECMDSLFEFGGQNAVNKSLTLESRLAGEGRRGDFDGEMTLAALVSASAAMPGMFV